LQQLQVHTAVAAAAAGAAAAALTHYGWIKQYQSTLVHAYAVCKHMSAGAPIGGVTTL
jgi:hypothetical protein